jgi:hypothetical protein
MEIADADHAFLSVKYVSRYPAPSPGIPLPPEPQLLTHLSDLSPGEDIPWHSICQLSRSTHHT